MKDFGSWVNDMAGTIPDASTIGTTSETYKPIDLIDPSPYDLERAEGEGMLEGRNTEYAPWCFPKENTHPDQDAVDKINRKLKEASKKHKYIEEDYFE